MPRKSVADIDLFRGVDRAITDRIERACQWTRVAKGRQILGQQDTTSDLYFVLEGTVRIFGYSASGKAVSFSDIRAASLFGEFAAIDDRPRSATVIAIGDCLIGRLRSDLFRELLLENPEIALRLLEMVVSKARDLTDRVFEFSTLPADSRLHIELLRMSGLLDSDAAVGRIDPAPTHQAIAERISAHREGVTRELNRLRDQGIIRHTRGLIEILDCAALRDIVRQVDGS